MPKKIFKSTLSPGVTLSPFYPPRTCPEKFPSPLRIQVERTCLTCERTWPTWTSGGGEERQKRQLRQISRGICDVIMTEFFGIFLGVM